ncbi:MAG: PHP domain-containing protein [Bryobacteraceae bacterium]
MALSRDSALTAGFIDLHSHTNESDGTVTPAELICLAKGTGLSGLAITDHDTFAGYEKAEPLAAEAELDLLRGIELNSRLSPEMDREQRHVHVLAYFPSGAPLQKFSSWLAEEQEDRRTRNRRLIDALQKRGVEITLQEVEARGRSMAGRPHFARILVEKGYAADFHDAFERYLGESAPSYVERQSQTTEEAIQIIRAGGGIPVVAHPVRLSLPQTVERQVLQNLKDAGLLGLEVYHSEHPDELQVYYLRLAEELQLLPTGGSDFHGAAKPGVKLGTGLNDNVRVPREFLDRMRAEFSADPKRLGPPVA